MQDQLITILAITFFALVAAVIASKFKQPVLLGFLLVGAIIGPHTLNFVRDQSVINIIIEIGAALLLFTIGLEFDLSKLKKVGMKSIFIGIFKIGIIFFIGYHVFIMFLGVKEAALLGVIISFSSTIIIIKILESRNMLVRQEIPTLIAILIIEDLIAVAFLTLLTGFAKNAGGGILPVLEHLFNSLFILIMVYIVLLAVLKPIFKRIILKNTNDSVMIFTALSMILLLSYLAHMLGFSFSLGAFLAGSLISSLVSSKSESNHFHHAISPFSFLFTSLFFIAIGALVDLKSVWQYKFIILAIIIVVIITRAIAVGLLTYLFSSFKEEQTFFSSIIMISVGEFSLLIAREGMNLSPSIDLVTITSVIIFLSAILMSFTLNYATSKDPLSQKQVFHTKIKVIASYIKESFEGLDIENTYTTSLRKSLNLIGGLIIAFFIFVNLFVSFQELTDIIGNHLLATILYWTLAAGILFLIGRLVYKEGHKAYHTLAVILANQSFTRDVKRSKKILKASIVSMFLILVALFLPIVFFLLDLSKYWSILPLVILAIGLLIIRDAFVHMDSSLKDNQFPQYQKLNSFTFHKYATPKVSMKVKEE